MHIILQSPTYQAARTGTPDTTEVARGLRLSGIEDYSVGHMLRCVIPAKPKGNAAAWVAKVRRGAEHCAQYTQLPELPIVTVGKETFTFYSGDKGDIYMWRGFRTEVEI